MFLLIHDGKKLLHIPISEIKEWAIAIKGPIGSGTRLDKGKEIIYRKQLGMDTHVCSCEEMIFRNLHLKRPILQV